MKIIEIGGHNEMCGGYSYDYEITFGKYGNTLKDVLKEIKEYSYEHSFAGLSNFGNPNVDICGRHWGIYVNGDIYIDYNQPSVKKVVKKQVKKEPKKDPTQPGSLAAQI